MYMYIYIYICILTLYTYWHQITADSRQWSFQCFNASDSNWKSNKIQTDNPYNFTLLIGYWMNTHYKLYTFLSSWYLKIQYNWYEIFFSVYSSIHYRLLLWFKSTRNSRIDSSLGTCILFFRSFFKIIIVRIASVWLDPLRLQIRKI